MHTLRVHVFMYAVVANIGSVRLKTRVCLFTCLPQIHTRQTFGVLFHFCAQNNRGLCDVDSLALRMLLHCKLEGHGMMNHPVRNDMNQTCAWEAWALELTHNLTCDMCHAKHQRCS
jgi:hypothetical protein